MGNRNNWTVRFMLLGSKLVTITVTHLDSCGLISHIVFVRSLSRDHEPHSLSPLVTIEHLCGNHLWKDEYIRHSEKEPVLDLRQRSEEHTSELQSRLHLVCRL